METRDAIWEIRSIYRSARKNLMHVKLGCDTIYINVCEQENLRFLSITAIVKG